jgi:pilus assembly protein CpaE
MSIRVLIAEQDADLRNQMRDMLGSNGTCEIVGFARDGQEAIQMSVQLSPQVAFISYDLPGISGPQTCEMLNALAPGIMSVLVSDTKSQSRVDAAMRSGARALISKPPSGEELRALASELAAVGVRRDSSEYQEWKDPSRFPRVVAITGAKGGVGKTTIAVNLSVTLAKRFPNKVALLDLYTQFGDVATMFNIQPKHVIADMATICDDLDADLVSDYVTRHPSGVDILVTAVDPLALDAVDGKCLSSLLHVLKRTYQYVIVDVPPFLHESTLQVLTHANLVLLVANLFDVTTASDTSRIYRALRDEHISAQNIRVVLNRVSKTNRLHVMDVEQMFDCDIAAHIPNDSRLVGSVNRGIPLALSDGDSPLGRSLARLSDVITGNASAPEEEQVTRRGIFGSK